MLIITSLVVAVVLAITSKPVNSSVYGMVMGYLIFSTFQKLKKINKIMFGFLKKYLVVIL
jgi:hypothetical protein